MTKLKESCLGGVMPTEEDRALTEEELKDIEARWWVADGALPLLVAEIRHLRRMGFVEAVDEKTL